MGRSVYDYTLNQPQSLIQYIANDYFAKEGFRLINYRGEQVWKKGTGMMTAPSYIKINYQNGVLHLEAWIRCLGERALDKGFLAIIPKKAHQKRVEELLGLLCQRQPVYSQSFESTVADVNPVTQPQTNNFVPPNPSTPPYSPNPDPQQQNYTQQGYPQQNYAQQGYYPQQGSYPQQPMGQPPYVAPVQMYDPTKKAVLSLVLGLVSFLGIFSPIVGVICGSIGIASGRTGRSSSKRGMAIAGLTLSIIGLVLSIISWVTTFLFLFLNNLV